MPEVNADAAILIATSWQALGRAHHSTGQTQLCDCTVVILFAGFFMEATLNEIIERIGRRHDMLGFLRNPHPGLQDKLAWFYNEYVARKKALTKKQMYRDRIADKIRRKFPGFAGLHRFRNDVAHGLINKDARSLETALTLRQQAKDIVDSFLKITRKAGHDIRPETTYWEAIESHS